MPHPFFACPAPLVIGHRGAAGHAPENTLPSFSRGLSDGAAILETDLHVTRDGVPVLSHDAEVDRTTDGSGEIAEHRFKELARLDAGFRFGPDGGFPFRGRGVRIPSLEEVLVAFPGARFNIEIKVEDGGLIERTLALLERLGRAELTLLTAAEDTTMALLAEAVARTGARVALGACTGQVLAFLRAVRGEGDPPDGPMALQSPPSFQGATLVDPPLLDLAHRQGVQVHAWTINDPEEMRRLLRMGIDGLVSDYPGRLSRVVAELRSVG